MISKGLHLLETYKEFIRNLSINVFYRVIIVAINLVSGIIISRDLMEANRGLFSIILTSFFLFNTALNFGINGSAAYFAKADPAKLKSFLSTGLIVAFLSSILLVALIFFKIYTFQNELLKYVFLVGYFLFSIQVLFRSILIGMDFNIFSQKIDVITRSFYLVFIIILHQLGYMSVFNVIIFIILEYTAFSIIANYKLKLSIFPFQIINLSFFKETFLINSKMYLSGVLGVLLLRGDQFIVKKLLGNYNVGLYTVGSTILENLGVVTSMICVMYLPKLIEEKNLTEKFKKTNKLLVLIAGISIIIAFIFYFLSPYIIELYYKKANIEAAESLQILLIGFVFWSLFTFISYVYFSIRIKKSYLIIIAFCVLINLSINYIYLPLNGIKAAAWASTISYFLLFVLSYFDLFYLKKKNFLKKEAQNSL